MTRYYNHTQQIEATSKKWKMVQLVGAVALVGGLVGLLVDPSVGAVMAITGGFFMYLLGRLCGWWFNG